MSLSPKRYPPKCRICGAAHSTCKGEIELRGPGIFFGPGILSKKAEEAHKMGTMFGPSPDSLDSSLSTRIVVPSDFERGTVPRRAPGQAPAAPPVGEEGLPRFNIDDDPESVLAGRQSTPPAEAPRRKRGEISRRKVRPGSGGLDT